MINFSKLSIRKIQLDCNLLHWCNSQEDLNVKTFEGYVFDKLEKADDLFQYIVYISEINMASKITTRENINNYTLDNLSFFTTYYIAVTAIDKDGNETDIVTKGRHDPCVGIRGAPVVEAMMACVLADHWLRYKAQCL